MRGCKIPTKGFLGPELAAELCHKHLDKAVSLQWYTRFSERWVYLDNADVSEEPPEDGAQSGPSPAVPPEVSLSPPPQPGVSYPTKVATLERRIRSVEEALESRIEKALDQIETLSRWLTDVEDKVDRVAYRLTEERDPNDF